MGLLSLQFLLLASIIIVGYRVVPWQAGRTALLTLANLVFVGSFAGSTGETLAEQARALLPFAAFLLQGWILIQWLQGRQTRLALGLSVGWMVLIFIVLKQYSFIAPVFDPQHIYVTVGLSYVFFRVLHLMIDTATGETFEGLTPLRYFNYSCMFLCFVSGPIQRYEDYRREETGEHAPPLDGELLFQTLRRIVLGLIKLVLLAPVGSAVHQDCVRAMAGGSGMSMALPMSAQFGLGLLAYLMFLYWNFSGSMDVIIGTGRLMGFGLPENFNRPLGAPNLIDFWTRWHMTLSNWFRLYLFNPTVTFLTRMHTDVRLAPYYGVVGFFVTFFIMGAWHGTTAVIILHGLMLGAGVSLNKLYQLRMRAWLGKKRHVKLNANYLYLRLSNALTIAFLAASQACFWLEGSDLARAGWRGALGAFACSMAITAVVAALTDGLRWVRVRSGIERLLEWRWTQQAVLALALLLLILYAALTKSDAPAFFYATF